MPVLLLLSVALNFFKRLLRWTVFGHTVDFLSRHVKGSCCVKLAMLFHDVTVHVT